MGNEPAWIAASSKFGYEAFYRCFPGDGWYFGNCCGSVCRGISLRE